MKSEISRYYYTGHRDGEIVYFNGTRERTVAEYYGFHRWALRSELGPDPDQLLAYLERMGSAVPGCENLIHQLVERL